MCTKGKQDGGLDPIINLKFTSSYGSSHASDRILPGVCPSSRTLFSPSIQNVLHAHGDPAMTDSWSLLLIIAFSLASLVLSSAAGGQCCNAKPQPHPPGTRPAREKLPTRLVVPASQAENTRACAQFYFIFGGGASSAKCRTTWKTPLCHTHTNPSLRSRRESENVQLQHVNGPGHP